MMEMTRGQHKLRQRQEQRLQCTGDVHVCICAVRQCSPTSWQAGGRYGDKRQIASAQAASKVLFPLTKLETKIVDVSLTKTEKRDSNVQELNNAGETQFNCFSFLCVFLCLCYLLSGYDSLNVL